MKKLLAALVIQIMAGSLAVSGCSTIAARSGQEQVATYDERSLLTAEIAYGTALTAISNADAVGLITPEVAESLIPMLEAAQESIEIARSMYDANRLVEASAAGDSAVLRVAALLQLLINAGILK